MRNVKVVFFEQIMLLSEHDNSKGYDMAKGLSITRSLDKILALICICIMGYEFFIGGLPRVVLLIASMGFLAYFIAYLKTFKR